MPQFDPAAQHPQPGPGYWYVAGPYSHKDPDVQVSRYLEHREATAKLLRGEVWVYSPITHTHELAHAYGLPKHAAYWEKYNFEMLRASKGLILLTGIHGWMTSLGVRGECTEASRLGLPLWGLELREEEFVWTSYRQLNPAGAM